MNAVASVSASPSGTLAAIRAVSSASSLYSSLTVKSAGKISQSHPVTAAKSSAPVEPQTLPLGLLLSVSQPSSSNLRAGLDYTDLRNALKSDNLLAAQQAYTRLQSDLLMGDEANSTTLNNVTGNNGHLNVTV